ncbi:hypothetical protein H312_01842 [Anncaliia algerae PRA339]|uniref:Uncharacterized protein n=1 Tax=Anncaliia algerae PRA339 TaxID=1288291 RepID=A0A059F0B6_9MICR|nr:hypothetical protein H312_01842 [Anncaliia algerae PRA339]
MLKILIHWYILCINASASKYSDELGKDSSLGRDEFNENPFGGFLCLISDLNLLKIGFFKSQMTYDCFHEIHQKVEVGCIDEKISQEYLLNLIYSKKEIKNILIRPSLLIHKFCSENRNQKTDGIYKQLRNILNEVIKDYSNMLANFPRIFIKFNFF